MIDARRIQLTPQPGYGLCWAACAHMLLQASGAEPLPTVRDIMAMAVALGDATEPELEEHDITALFGKLRLRTAFYERAMTEAELDLAVYEQRPVISVISDPATDRGHAVVIAGQIGDEYRVLDPARGSDVGMPYTRLLAPRGDLEWLMSWELLARP